jgi:CheY-like chemotaxis protein
VLTDIAVPGLDGIELCRRLRADIRTCHVPVLAVTGYDDRRYPDRIIQAGANRVLLKPLDAAVLLAEAQRLLPEI